MSTPPTDVEHPSAFRPVPRTGVIYVMTEAQRHGYRPGDPEWCNLGQGAPETGPLPGSPPRCTDLHIDATDQEYAPVAGLWELRETVAGLYNELFRKGLPSQYSAENVSIAGGGRSALTRLAAALGPVHLGHFLPDYTAYEELLGLFRAFLPTPIPLEHDRGYAFSVEDLRREITGRGIAALLLSNPCNPTGKVIGGEELRTWVETARKLDCALLLDEFYSHYVWSAPPSDRVPIVTAARYVEDVNRDPVVIVDGLTKNWRYPGWRLSWTLGPKQVIEAVASAGSFLDGGGSRPLQRAALDVLTADIALRETAAIREAFSVKRRLMLDRLRWLGVRFDREPDGTFYCWGSVASLPPGLNDCWSFFRAALERKIITVPGEFFDVDPGKRRHGRLSRFRSHIRFSFGPSEESLTRALDGIEKMVTEARG